VIDSPTLILEDDERTVVSPARNPYLDRTPQRRNPVIEVNPFRAAVLLALAALAAGIVGFFAAWLVHERDAASRLREELERVAARPDHQYEHEASGSAAASRGRAVMALGHASLEPPEALEDRLSDAVDLLIENRFLEALRVYRELRVSLPEDTVLAEMVTVLEATLGCHLPQEEGGNECR
jgi:hypothetical protein